MGGRFGQSVTHIPGRYYESPVVEFSDKKYGQITSTELKTMLTGFHPETVLFA